MEKQEMLKMFDNRVLEMLRDALWYLDNEHENLARQSVECARMIAWVADDLDLISFDDWSVINRLLLDTYFRLF